MNAISGTWWWFDGFYYLSLEIVPLCIMLYLLRMNRKRFRHSSNNTSGEEAALINSA
eukprot:gene8604-10592_t